MKRKFYNKTSAYRAITLLLFFTIILSQPLVIQAQTIIAGTGTPGYTGDGGAAVLATLFDPQVIIRDAAGNMYIADQGNNAIRKINTSGIISTVAGSPAAGGPFSMAVDAAGNIYIANSLPNVTKVDALGNVTTIAGSSTGISGYSGDGGPATAALLGSVYDIILDAVGNIYVATDPGVVRKIDTAGLITTVAGNGIQGYSGDGNAATLASLNYPNGLVFDAVGNLYIADYGSAIRKVDTAGIISTVAGNGTSGFSGDGGPATAALLSEPNYMTIDAAGNIFVTDGGNNNIRKINTAGIISTIDSSVHNPHGIAIDASNNIYVSLFDNHQIIELTGDAPCQAVAGTISSAAGNTFCDSAHTSLSLNGQSSGTGITYYWQSSINGVQWNYEGADTFCNPRTITTTTYFRTIVACSTSGSTDTARDTIIITPSIVPTISISAHPGTNVGAGTTITFTATAINGGTHPTYQWLNNNIPIPGATDSTYISNTLTDSSTISCVVHSNVSCALPDTAISNGLLVRVGLDVNTIAGNISGLQLYPSPNNGIFNIQGTVNGSEKAKIEILNAMGQVIYNAVILPQNGKINTQIKLENEMANGVYLLRFKTETGNSSIRFVVEK